MTALSLAEKTKPTHRRRKEARPQELRAAALSLFVEKGFAATRLDEVAARAGVSKGTLYLYFDSKEALFLSVIQEGILPALDQGREVLALNAENPVVALRTYLYGWWTMIGDTDLAGVPKLMMSEARNFPEIAQYYLDEVIQPARLLLQEILERGVELGVFRPVDPATVTHILMSPLLQLVMWRHSFAACCQVPDMDPTYYIENFLNLVLNGLSVGAEGKAS
jgi:AcrR family transcriptional regulator